MNSKQFRLVLMGIFSTTVLLFIVIWFAGSSILKKQSSQMVDLKVSNQTADSQLDNLEASKKDIAKYSYFKSIASSVIPNDKDQAEAVIEINQLAGEAGISIQSVTFPTSDLGSTIKSASAATASTSSLISQAKPVAGIKGLYSVELTITPATGAQVTPDKIVTYPKPSLIKSIIKSAGIFRLPHWWPYCWHTF
jgi:hypothetical protein